MNARGRGRGRRSRTVKSLPPENQVLMDGSGVLCIILVYAEWPCGRIGSYSVQLSATFCGASNSTKITDGHLAHLENAGERLGVGLGEVVPSHRFCHGVGPLALPPGIYRIAQEYRFHCPQLVGGSQPAAAIKPSSLAYHSSRDTRRRSGDESPLLPRRHSTCRARARQRGRRTRIHANLSKNLDFPVPNFSRRT